MNPARPAAHAGASTGARTDRLLWRLRKDVQTASARLLDNGAYGCELQIFRDGKLQSGRRYDSLETALAEGDGVREMYIGAGWTPE
jgi:hypothetical protein